MTTQNNSIIVSDNNDSFVYHGNRLLIVAFSIAGLLADDPHVSNLLFSLSIILWLWIPELEVFENKLITRANLKLIFLIMTMVLMVVVAYVALGVFFSLLNKWLHEPMVWVFSVVAFIAIASLFYNAIQWLAKHNPVSNTGKETKEVRRHFMTDHKIALPTHKRSIS